MANPTPLPISTTLETRDGTSTTKDARITNMLAEKKGDETHFLKRPGYQIYAGGTWTPLTALGAVPLSNDTVISFAGDISSGPTSATVQTTAFPGTTPVVGAWTGHAPSSIASWTNVAYGNGRFVSTSGGGVRLSMYSTDNGATWNAGGLMPDTTPAGSGQWTSITYVSASGLFVAVGYNLTDGSGIIATSSDATAWTSRATVASKELFSVAANGNTVCAVAGGSWGGTNQIMTSVDGGLNWSAKATGTNRNWTSITYGAGKFVAIGTNSGSIYALTSTDGLSWSQTNTSFAMAGFEKDIAYGVGLFVMVGKNGANSIASSVDGISWVQRTSPGSTHKVAVAFGNGLFMTVGDGISTNNTAYSVDGISWVALDSANSNPWWDVAYGNGTFVSTSFNNSSSSNEVMNVTISWV